MAAAIIKKKPFEPIKFTVSGTTYEHAKLAKFHIKPIKSRKIGGFGGVQYTYVVNTHDEKVQFQDRLAEAAADVADEFGDDHYIHLALVKDAGHL